MVTSCCLCAKECVPFNPQRSFHRIPTDEEMKNKWFSIIGRTVSYKGARVCSDHFTDDDFHERSPHTRIRRLKNTAIPSIYIKRNRKNKMEDSSMFQKTEINETEFQNDSETESQNDSETKSQNDSETKSQNEKNVTYRGIKNYEDNNTGNDIESKKSENIEQESIPVLDIIKNLDDVPLDLEEEINTILIDNKKDDDNFVNENDRSKKRKFSSFNLRNSKIKKFFVHMSKYNIECFRKIDFSSDKKWSAFVRYVTYNRHKTKILTQKTRRLEKKMYILQDMLEELLKT